MPLSEQQRARLTSLKKSFSSKYAETGFQDPSKGVAEPDYQSLKAYIEEVEVSDDDPRAVALCDFLESKDCVSSSAAGGDEKQFKFDKNTIDAITQFRAKEALDKARLVVIQTANDPKSLNDNVVKAQSLDACLENFKNAENFNRASLTDAEVGAIKRYFSANSQKKAALEDLKKAASGRINAIQFIVDTTKLFSEQEVTNEQLGGFVASFPNDEGHDREAADDSAEAMLAQSPHGKCINALRDNFTSLQGLDDISDLTERDVNYILNYAKAILFQREKIKSINDGQLGLDELLSIVDNGIEMPEGIRPSGNSVDKIQEPIKAAAQKRLRLIETIRDVTENKIPGISLSLDDQPGRQKLQAVAQKFQEPQTPGSPTAAQSAAPEASVGNSELRPSVIDLLRSLDVSTGGIVLIDEDVRKISVAANIRNNQLQVVGGIVEAISQCNDDEKLKPLLSDGDQGLHEYAGDIDDSEIERFYQKFQSIGCQQLGSAGCGSLRQSDVDAIKTAILSRREGIQNRDVALEAIQQSTSELDLQQFIQAMRLNGSNLQHCAAQLAKFDNAQPASMTQADADQVSEAAKMRYKNLTAVSGAKAVIERCEDLEKLVAIKNSSKGQINHFRIVLQVVGYEDSSGSLTDNDIDSLKIAAQERAQDLALVKAKNEIVKTVDLTKLSAIACARDDSIEEFRDALKDVYDDTNNAALTDESIGELKAVATKQAKCVAVAKAKEAIATCSDPSKLRQLVESGTAEDGFNSKLSSILEGRDYSSDDVSDSSSTVPASHVATSSDVHLGLRFIGDNENAELKQAAQARLNIFTQKEQTQHCLDEAMDDLSGRRSGRLFSSTVSHDGSVALSDGVTITSITKVEETENDKAQWRKAYDDKKAADAPEMTMMQPNQPITVTSRVLRVSVKYMSEYETGRNRSQLFGGGPEKKTVTGELKAAVKLDSDAKQKAISISGSKLPKEGVKKIAPKVINGVTQFNLPAEQLQELKTMLLFADRNNWGGFAVHPKMPETTKDAAQQLAVYLKAQGVLSAEFDTKPKVIAVKVVEEHSALPVSAIQDHQEQGFVDREQVLGGVNQGT